jgi:hypothetical protein
MVTATAPASRTKRTPSRASRRFGYLVAIGGNAVMLYVAQHLLDWGWPRFLTDEFDEVLPIMTVSFIAGMVANALFVVYDAGWFKSLGNVVTMSIGFVVALRLLQVYPFDFSTYAVNWSWLVRTVLVVGMVGAAVGVLVESVKLVTWPFRDHPEIDRPETR